MLSEIVHAIGLIATPIGVLALLWGIGRLLGRIEQSLETLITGAAITALGVTVLVAGAAWWLLLALPLGFFVTLAALVAVRN